MKYLRYWPWLAGAILLLVAVSAIRSTATANERARVADSTAKATQKDRARVDKDIANARVMVAALGAAVNRLKADADSSRAKALRATRATERANTSRDSAIVALRGSATAGDSLSALLAKSSADDSVIAGQATVIDAKSAEVTLLRSALDSTDSAAKLLFSAVDSARVQLRRDGVVIQQLQTALRTSRPSFVHRWGERLLYAGAGYAIGHLTR